MKGSRAEEELALSQNAIKLLGGKNATLFEYELSGGEGRSIITIGKGKPSLKITHAKWACLQASLYKVCPKKL